MKFLVFILSFSVITITSIKAQNLPQNSIKFFDDVTSLKNLKELPLDKFVKYDFSNLWLKDQDAQLGFIGNNYQRFFIHFISIIKNADKSNLYYVYGKTKVKNNICQFIGTFKVTHIYIYNEVLYLNDDKDTSDINNKIIQGYILAEYTLYEDPKQKGSGIFRGITQVDIYIKNNKIYYDDLFSDADGYSNNAFVGTWTSYKTGKNKICNWGYYRIPYSGDLDSGTGDFMPYEKYWKYGWKDFINNHYGVDTTNFRKEMDWWK